MKLFKRLALVLMVSALPVHSRAAEVSVAVASNFTPPMRQIAADFENATGHKVLLSFNASGKFYAQIKNGAPYHLLLSADEEKPAQLEKEGLAVPGSRFTYAVGRLVLWSARPDVVDAKGEVLRKGRFKKLAVANPHTAPYGDAAMQVLANLGLTTAMLARVVYGENIAQTYQFTASGNTELGFVALSQIMKDGRITGGSAWVIPDSLHAPIRQDAVLLLKGKGNPAAEALLKYLKSDRAKDCIRAYGYRI